ncbi:MAG: alanine racemase [Actinomycetota bacterium]
MNEQLTIEELTLWAEVDLGAIRHNVKAIKNLLKPQTRLLTVVKANAYGHGDAAVAPAAVAAGADWLGVARVQEARSVREAGVGAPILLLAEPPAGAVGLAVQLEVTPTVYTEANAERLAAAAEAAGKTLNVHLKVDTGMHRYGAAPGDVPALVKLIDSLPSLHLEGIWSHFAVAEDVLNPFTKQQFERFMDVLEDLGPRAGDLIRHIANSSAILTFADANLDMARAGITVYGLYPSPELEDRADLQPALSLKSRVGLVKRLPADEAISYGQRYCLPHDGLVATVPCGYADGLRRTLTNNGQVLIRGKRHPICGSVTMDHFLVDAGNDHLEIGDEVVIIGSQGEETITAQEVADRMSTIPYEVVCSISARVPRLYLNV